jgi:GNAT superfamily N-acetyltransferase
VTLEADDREGCDDVTAIQDGVRALLTDGGVVRIRVLTSSDQDEVLELHRRLSDRDTHLRFFGFARSFLPTIARRITCRSDVKHLALDAYRGDVLVCVAHCETFTDPSEAEIAFVVDSAVQAHGLGTLLLEHLASVPVTAGCAGSSPKCWSRTSG